MKQATILPATTMLLIFLISLGSCKNNRENSETGQREVLIPPEPRLQMDIGPNSPDLQWWYDANEVVDQRLDWWRKVRFGCFIHWNASSLLAGEWKGKIYGGYGEHIQRMAQIPCSVYRRDVVGSFNPTGFNADDWVRAIHYAGMRYLVITAKHHDGFAVYDSDVSDYNILDATPFDRDPMTELKKACDKYGVKFGFYYSHAFDWGEANGPGNDWDYENPGGDSLLFGGRYWYDQHPELVPRIRKYVDKKSIPQVKELIEKYVPDIMWFDTPHKLPPEENLRILKVARTLKPDMVINSRVVQSYQGRPHHFGDYLSTSDRAVDFYERDGDWESIPTTNESYGYNKHDHSHKTPEFLIQVLVKAAARGGNMLLNIGPKADGKIDEIDLRILEGIGNWMEINEVSIRGTEQTTLPVQPWGESTKKGNTLYLHVFNWPNDGILEMGGFLGKINKAWLLSDKNKTSLTHKRTDKSTLLIEVPSKAPDPSNSVVVLEVDNVDNVSKNRLLSTKQKNVLRAFDGLAVGSKLKFGNGKSNRNVVSNWTGEEQVLTWPIHLSETGKFKLIAEYENKGKPNPFIVTSKNEKLQCTTRAGKPSIRDNFIMHELGTMEFQSGENLIEMHTDGIPEGDLMRLRALHFEPLK